MGQAAGEDRKKSFKRRHHVDDILLEKHVRHKSSKMAVAERGSSDVRNYCYLLLSREQMKFSSTKAILACFGLGIDENEMEPIITRQP